MPSLNPKGAWKRLQLRFDVEAEPAKLGSHRLLLPRLKNPVAYIQERIAISGTSDLPYWTKMWPAALVLASFVASRKGGFGRVLELGAGLGVPGLIAGACGRSVFLSDLEPDALDFACAAVELNKLEQNVRVALLDWANPPSDLGTFNTIVASEILYHPPLYPTLVTLLDNIMAPNATVYITHEQRPFSIGFFGLAAEKFTVRTTSSSVKVPDNDPVKVYLHALQRKELAQR